jgi:hydrogenase nickel incorporation protein HypA/HybF
MHEVGLVEGIVEAVERRANGRPVARVRVRIGTLHRAADGPMEQAFEMVGPGTVVEGAKLELIQIPVTTTCLSCGHAESDAERLPACPACGSISIDHAGGDELTLESIEYRPEPAMAGSDAG